MDSHLLPFSVQQLSPQNGQATKAQSIQGPGPSIQGIEHAPLPGVAQHLITQVVLTEHQYSLQ